MTSWRFTSATAARSNSEELTDFYFVEADEPEALLIDVAEMDVADPLGELANLYAGARLAFVGGTRTSRKRSVWCGVRETRQPKPPSMNTIFRRGNRSSTPSMTRLESCAATECAFD